MHVADNTNWAASENRLQVPKEYITEYLSVLKIRKKEGR